MAYLGAGLAIRRVPYRGTARLSSSVVDHDSEADMDTVLERYAGGY